MRSYWKSVNVGVYSKRVRRTMLVNGYQVSHSDPGQKERK
jgi:hypothetical protein